MTVALFPIQDTAQKYRLQNARVVAKRAGWDVHDTEQWMLSHGCSQIALNLLSELALEQRMANKPNPEPAA
jgi:hypothetical protein